MKTINFIVKAISTFFYVGYLPFIPGTGASVVALFLFYLVRNNGLAQLFLTLAVIILGFLVSGRAEKVFNKKDPKYVVIDEVAGMLLSLAFIPYDIRVVVIAFVLFRVFDILKPFPVRRLEKLPGSAGIMCDDIAAGIYTNIILQVLLRVVSFKAS